MAELPVMTISEHPFSAKARLTIRVDELRDKLERAQATPRPLRVKAGFDPTAPTSISVTPC
jgi:tyrosyl-tRNA synthetase